jgi:hypothetical protein
MATSTTPRTTTSQPEADASGRTAALGNSVADATETVRSAANDAVSRLPDVALTTRSAIEDANRQMRAGSDEMLSIGSALSFGVALGLLIGGAGRLLVAGALIPAAMMTLTLFDRSGRARRTGSGLQGR